MAGFTRTAGDFAQCDLWFPPRKILLEDGSRTLLQLLIITCGYPRYMLGRMIPTRKTPDLLLGLLSELGRVPRRLIWDDELGIGRGKLTELVAVFVGTLATKVVLLPPRGPESKGVVERRDHFFETSSCPDATSSPRSTSNGQFLHWLTTSNARTVRTTKARPVDLLAAADTDAMLPLPPAVLHLGLRNHVRLGWDYYVHVDTSDYSVHPRAVGAWVDAAANLDTVRPGSATAGSWWLRTHAGRPEASPVTDPPTSPLPRPCGTPISTSGRLPRPKTRSGTRLTMTRRSESTPARWSRDEPQTNLGSSQSKV